MHDGADSQVANHRALQVGLFVDLDLPRESPDATAKARVVE